MMWPLGSGVASLQAAVCACRPRTGRSHQIRAHLQHVGHPIANDQQYGGTYDGPQSTRNWGLLSVASAETNRESVMTGEARDVRSGRSLSGGRQGTVGAESGQQRESESRDEALEPSGAAAIRVPLEAQDSLCPNCPYVLPKRWPLDQKALWLHARQYSCSLWSFHCPSPFWGAADWVEPA